jgi:hypothetical protein
MNGGTHQTRTPRNPAWLTAHAGTGWSSGKSACQRWATVAATSTRAISLASVTSLVSL